MPASAKQIQELIDKVMQDLDTDGDGTVTWPEMLETVVQRVLDNPNADPEDMRKLFEKNVTSEEQADDLIVMIQNINVFDEDEASEKKGKKGKKVKDKKKDKKHKKHEDKKHKKHKKADSSSSSDSD